jgi:hypothetical protein
MLLLTGLFADESDAVKFSSENKNWLKFGFSNFQL